jgi:hypothetical protein
MYRPLLTRRPAAGRDDQRHKIPLTAAGDVQAFPTDACDLAVGKRPILTRAPVASNSNDARAVERIAALDVHAPSAHSDDLSVFRVPRFSGSADTRNKTQRRPVDRISMPGKIGALIVGIVYDLAGAGGQ